MRKERGVEIKALDQTTFFFCFEEEDLMLVLHRAPWNFNNSHVLVKSVEPSMCPSPLNFDSISFWIQLHDLPPNWRKSTMVLKIA